MAHIFSFESHFDESSCQSCYNWRTLRSCVRGIELLVLVQNIWAMQLKLWLKKEKSDEFFYCTTTRQHLVSISYAIEPCQRKKSRKYPLQNNFLVWDFECCLKKKTHVFWVLSLKYFSWKELARHFSWLWWMIFSHYLVNWCINGLFVSNFV